MRLVFVPGFSQTQQTWAGVTTLVAAESLAVDVPTGLSFPETAGALADLGGGATYVGYSMGGRLCLRLALDRPQVVERLVLVSASPGIADPERRAARRADDERLALDAERDGADSFLERWLAQPLFATLPRGGSARSARIHDVAVLAHQLRALGQGAMEPLWDRLGELTMPVVLVVGGLDEKYGGLAHEMAAHLHDARVHVIAGAGHAVHLEAPGALARALGT